MSYFTRCHVTSNLTSITTLFFFLKSRTWPSNAPLFLSRSPSFLCVYVEMRRSEVSASPCPFVFPRRQSRRLLFNCCEFTAGAEMTGGQEGGHRRMESSECVGNAAGRARGRLTAEFVSLSCWGGLRTCCNTAAGQTEWGSLWGRPAEGTRGKKISACKIVVHKSGRQSRQRKGMKSEPTGVDKQSNLAESCWSIVIKWWHGGLASLFFTPLTHFFNSGTAAWDFVFMQSSVSCATITACTFFFSLTANKKKQKHLSPKLNSAEMTQRLFIWR